MWICQTFICHSRPDIKPFADSHLANPTRSSGIADKPFNACVRRVPRCAVKSWHLANDCDLLAEFSDFYVPLSQLDALNEGAPLERTGSYLAWKKQSGSARIWWRSRDARKHGCKRWNFGDVFIQSWVTSILAVWWPPCLFPVSVDVGRCRS